MGDGRKMLVQAWSTDEMYLKVSRIANLTGSTRADVVRKAVQEFIDDFEARNGDNSLRRKELEL